MNRFARSRWIGAGILLAGVVGVTMAVTAVVAALPAPVAGGTCGPGRSSEGALFAFLDPGSIGAGVQPAVTNTSAHFQWLAFVSECQSATNSRMLGGLFALVLGLGAIAVGMLLLRRTPLWRADPSASSDEHPITDPSSPGDPWAGRASSSPGWPAPDQPQSRPGWPVADQPEPQPTLPGAPPPRDVPVGIIRG